MCPEPWSTMRRPDPLQDLELLVHRTKSPEAGVLLGREELRAPRLQWQRFAQHGPRDDGATLPGWRRTSYVTTQGWR